MKTILVAVVGTIGLVATPAVAGSKKPSTPSKPSTTRIAQADAAKSDAAKPSLVAAAANTPSGDVAAEVTPSPELLAIPVLPVDTSNALTQLADLEKPRAVVLASPAKKLAAKAPVLDLGQRYVLGGHKVDSTPKEEVEQFVPRGLTDAQISTVVQTQSADLQVCWAKLPAAQRADRCAAMMKLSIDDGGKVTGVELGGDVPASTHACITSVVKRWQFPAAETSTVAETGVSMRSL